MSHFGSLIVLQIEKFVEIRLVAQDVNSILFNF